MSPQKLPEFYGALRGERGGDSHRVMTPPNAGGRRGQMGLGHISLDKLLLYVAR